MFVLNNQIFLLARWPDLPRGQDVGWWVRHGLQHQVPRQQALRPGRHHLGTAQAQALRQGSAQRTGTSTWWIRYIWGETRIFISACVSHLPVFLGPNPVLFGESWVAESKRCTVWFRRVSGNLITVQVYRSYQTGSLSSHFLLVKITFLSSGRSLYHIAIKTYFVVTQLL